MPDTLASFAARHGLDYAAHRRAAEREARECDRRRDVAAAQGCRACGGSGVIRVHNRRVGCPRCQG